MPPESLAALAKFDTATICNTIELFEVRPDTAGFMDARIRSAFPDLPPTVGYASTASFRSAVRLWSGSAAVAATSLPPFSVILQNF